MIIRDRWKFAVGAAGLASFFVVLVVWVSPLVGHRSGLAWADDFFNQLGKNSAYFLPELIEQAAAHQGKAFDVTFKAASPEDAARVARVFAVGLGADGAQAQATGESVHLRGDLGAAAMALMVDCEPLFRNQDGAVRDKYGLSGREVLYGYWIGFGAVYKYYMSSIDVPSANFASAMRTKVCEPIYNFWGTAPTRASEAKGKLAFLLVFYVVYTVWFGFSIMFLFEGMDIGVRRAKKREV